MEINIASDSTQRGNGFGDVRGLTPLSGEISRHIISTSYNILGMIMTVEFYTGITVEAADIYVVPNKETIRDRTEAAGVREKNISTRRTD